MEVIVAHDKHGTELHNSALALLAARLRTGWYYDNWDDGDIRHQWEDRARRIVEAKVAPAAHEELAWRFLQERSDHEYEYVEKQTVQ